ncbi:hypothetical protein BJY52DRAFT_1189614 [Lactarius psammicola]|nr:hypothetical protein BJY52DRAFT_1189614 [Lactarius psammicola]
MVSMTSRNSDSTGAESTDPDIRMAYQSITLQGSLNWLILTYGKWSPSLKLFAAGSQGLPELKQCITQSEHSIFFAFLRLFVDVAPNPISRYAARTSVAGRTVQSWFKGQQATLTISHLENLTASAIREAMPYTPVRPVGMARTSSEAPANREKSLPHAPGPVTRTASEPATYLSMRGPPNFGDPAMRSELREAARRASEAEDRAAVREEAARQVRIKWLREQEARKAEEEEDARRAQLERDLARSAAVRMAREEEERAEEEKRARERELARRLEEQRLEEVRRLEEVAKAEEELKHKAMERREAARFAGAKRRRESRLAGDSLLLSGWVTVQNSESVTWRRRYFQMTDTLIRFYSKDKDVTGVPVDVVVLKGVKPSVKEWYEGFEELRAIPYSFALIPRQRRVAHDALLRLECRKGSTHRSFDDVFMTVRFNDASTATQRSPSPPRSLRKIEAIRMAYSTLLEIQEVTSAPDIGQDSRLSYPGGPSLTASEFVAEEVNSCGNEDQIVKAGERHYPSLSPCLFTVKKFKDRTPACLDSSSAAFPH